jgi:hypothetical protein
VESVLDIRPTLVMSALFATWLAVALLTVMVLYLQVRVARLEAGRSAVEEDPPFKGLVGRLVPELLAGEYRPRAVVFLSTTCRTCADVLEDLKRHRWRQPVAVAWTDTSGQPFPSRYDLPVLEAGPRIATSLGVRVTPFAIVLGDDGRIRQARPVAAVSEVREIDALRVVEQERAAVAAHIA